MIKYITTSNGYFRNILIVLLAVGGIAILYKYLFYLNSAHTALKPWAKDINWPITKMLICVAWLRLLFWWQNLCERRLSLKGYKVSHEARERSITAILVFVISVAGYDPPIIELAGYFFINTVGYAMVICAFLMIAPVRRFCTAFGKCVLQLFKQRSFYWCAVAFIFVFCMAYHMSWVLFQHFPWIDDTLVQVIHAKFLARGNWYIESMPLPQFFDMTMMVNDGKWYSQYPPGHVIMLALGTALGHVEMVNPFLGACTCIAVWLLAKELYGAHVAKIAVFLAAICAYMILLSSEYMSNATSLLMGTLFLWAYFRVLHRPGWHYALVAGAALGYCFDTRPYSAFGLATPAAFYAVYLIITQPRTYLVPMLAMLGSFTCFFVFQLYYNDATTGDPLSYGYRMLQGERDIPFTVTAFSNLTQKQLFDNLIYNLERLNYLNRMLFEWPVPSLSLVALLFAIRGNRRDERLLFATLCFMFFTTQIILNFDYGWGPRLVYEILGVLLVCSAKALSILPSLLRKLSSHRYSLNFYYGCGAMIIASFYLFAVQYNLDPKTIKDEYFLEEREGNPEFYKGVMKQVKPPALVFVPPNRYKFVEVTNPPDDTNPVIFAIDWGKQDELLIRKYPERNVYVVIDNGSKKPIIYGSDVVMY